MGIIISFDDPEFKRRYDEIQADLTAKVKAATIDLDQKSVVRWGPGAITAQRAFASMEIPEIMNAAVVVFTMANIVKIAGLKEFDFPGMATALFSSLFGYCLKARMEIARDEEATKEGETYGDCKS